MNDTNEYTTAAPWPKAFWIDIDPQELLRIDTRTQVRVLLYFL
jgi:hypothetical protein